MHRRPGNYVRSKPQSRQFRAAFFMSGSPASEIPAPHWWSPNPKEPQTMPTQSPDFDVISQPAMPPPPLERSPLAQPTAESPGMAKSADPRHNSTRRDQL